MLPHSRTGAGEAPSGIGVVSSQRAVEASGQDGSAPKRRKVDREEQAAKKEALEQLRAATDPTAPFSTQRRLPWAEKEVKVGGMGWVMCWFAKYDIAVHRPYGDGITA